MHIVPDSYPVDGMKAQAISKRLKAFSSTIAIWEGKKHQCEVAIAEYTRAREAFIAHLPELPVWMTERGEIGCDCPLGPDDAA